MTKTTAQAANQNAAQSEDETVETVRPAYASIDALDVEGLHQLMHEYIDNGAHGAETLIRMEQDTQPVTIPGRDKPYRFWDELEAARTKYRDDASFAEGFKLALRMQNAVENRALSAVYHDMVGRDAQARHGFSYFDLLGTALSEFASVLQRMSLIEHFVTKVLQLNVGTLREPGPDMDKMYFYKTSYHYMHEPFMQIARRYVEARDAEKNATRH